MLQQKSKVHIEKKYERVYFSGATIATKTGPSEWGT